MIDYWSSALCKNNTLDDKNEIFYILVSKR